MINYGYRCCSVMGAKLLLCVSLFPMVAGCVPGVTKPLILHDPMLATDQVSEIYGEQKKELNPLSSKPMRYVCIIAVDGKKLESCANIISVLPGEHTLDVVYRFQHANPQGFLGRAIEDIHGKKNRLHERKITFKTEPGKKYTIFADVEENVRNFTWYVLDLNFLVAERFEEKKNLPSSAPKIKVSHGDMIKVDQDYIYTSLQSHDYSSTDKKGKLFLRVELIAGYSNTEVYLNVEGRESILIEGWSYLELMLDEGEHKFSISLKKPETVISLENKNAKAIVLRDGQTLQYRFLGPDWINGIGELTQVEAF